MGRTSGGGGIVQLPVPSGPNVGQIQLNPQFMLTSGGYELLDLMKMAQMPWKIVGTSGAGALNPNNIDTNGYPISLAQGAVEAEINTPGSGRTGQSAQHYVIRWDGTGTVTCTGTLFSGSLTGTGANNRAVMDTTGGSSIFIGISALPVTNMHFYHIDDEADFLAGKIAGRQFKARIKQAQISVLRNLTWGGLPFNGAWYSNVTTWATRKPQSWVSYNGDEYRPSLFAGTTTNSGNDYSITFGSGAPADKQIIHLFFNASQSDTSTFSGGASSLRFVSGTPGTVNWGAALPSNVVVGAPILFGGFNGNDGPPELLQFSPYYVKSIISVPGGTFTISRTNGGTAINFSTNGGINLVAVRAPTLNLNGTGAVPLWDMTMQIIWGNGANLIALNSSQNSGTTSSIATLIYDADINIWTLYGGQGPGGHEGLGNGIPPETFLALCAEIGCHPWFTSTHFSCDPMTDYHTELARYCHGNAPAWMVPRFELINEPWNVPFPTGDYGQAKSLIHWGSQDFSNWIGKVASTMSQDINRIYNDVPGTGDRYHLIVNVQTGLSQTGADDDMLNSTSYVGQAAAAQPGYIKAAAKNYVTHIAITQYANSIENSTAANTAWSTATAPQKQLIIDAYLDGTGPGANGFTPTGVGLAASAGANSDGILGLQATYQATSAHFQTFTNTAGKKIRMCGYEGGLELGANNGNSAIFPFWDACLKQGTNIQLYATQNYNNFMSAGGEHPSQFMLSGFPARDNPWSCLIDVYQSPDPPEWLAIVSFA